MATPPRRRITDSRVTRLLSVLTGMMAGSMAFSASLPVAKPEAAGMSSVRLARIGAALNSDIERGLLPGAVVAVVRRGKLVYYESFGSVQKDSIFTIASMTKPLTASGALMLVEEGRILLNDPVGKYLPALDKVVVAASGGGTEPAIRKPTIQDLMRHTAGFTYGNRGTNDLYRNYPQSSGEVADAMSSDAFLARLAELPLFFQPGTRWDYSFGMDLLGLTVEAVSKQKLGEYLQARLFGPLGMAQTFRDPVKPNRFDCGGGCAYSTAMDYARFAEMLRNRGNFEGTHFLGRKTVEYMTSDQLGPEVNVDRLREFANMNGYGFGLSVAVRKGAGVSPIIGTAGDFNWGGANGTYFWVDPKEELSVVFMAAAPGELRVHFRQLLTALVLQAIAD